MTTLECYQRAVNKIEDFFEYRYNSFDKEETKKQAMKIIDELTNDLQKVDNGNSN